MTDLVKEARAAKRAGEEWAGTLPARDAVKVRPKDWHAICHYIDAIASRLEALEAAQQWRPIADAPKDETEIIAWDGSHVRVLCWRMRKPRGEWILPFGWRSPEIPIGDQTRYGPTHFMPLPLPPQMETRSNDE